MLLNNLKTSCPRLSHARGLVSFTTVLGCLYCLPVQAIEFAGSANLNSEYTSNTLRTEDSEIGEWIHQPGFAISASQDSTSWSLDAHYRYLRRLYQKDFWDNESITTGTGSARWFALPQRLDFFVSHTRSESSISARQVQTRDNRQVVSSTQAGSTLRFHPGGNIDSLQFQYAYEDTQSSNTQTGSKRHSGTVNYTALTWPTSSIQMRATHSDINYTGIFPDANTTIATLIYSKTIRKFSGSLTFGHNWYDRDDRGKTDDSTYDVVFLWRNSENSRLELNASHAIVDRSTNLSGNPDSVNENTGVNAAFNETRGRLSYTQKWGRTSLTLGMDWAKQEYAADVPLDNERIGLSLGLSRELTRSTSVSFDTNLGKRDFIDQGDEQDDIRVRFRVNHEIGPTISFNWGLNYMQQKSTSTNSFDEWRVTIALRYTFLGAR